MSLILKLASRQIGLCYLNNQKFGMLSVVRTITLKPKPACEPPKEGHDERNMRIGRPTSPYLTIYSPQLTSLLSISHRGTGLVLGCYLSALGLAGLIIPEDVPYYLSNLECYPALLPLVKFSLTFPFTYHFWNGIRHLFWDMGKFLSLKEVYMTGYVMLALAISSAVGLSII